MTGTIDIRLNADHPDEAVATHYVFVGSPSAPRVRNLPEKIGTWEIEGVYFSVTYPDGKMVSVQATDVDGVFVATIPKCETTGKVEGGFQVICRGTDESGEQFDGLCLGVGDLVVLPRKGSVDVGETKYFFELFDTMPETPKKGNVIIQNGQCMIYSGTVWVPFGSGGSWMFLTDVTLDLNADQNSINNALAEIVRRCGGTVID